MQELPQHSTALLHDALTPQDAGGTWLLGHESLQQLLGRLEPCRVAAAVAAHLSSSSSAPAAAGSIAPLEGRTPPPADLMQQRQQWLQGPVSRLAAPPFSLERGLGCICLVLLAKGPVQRQRDTAAAVVQQLVRLAEAIQKAPPPQQRRRQRTGDRGAAGDATTWAPGSAEQRRASGVDESGGSGGGVGGGPGGGVGSPVGPCSPTQAAAAAPDRRASGASDGSAQGGGGAAPSAAAATPDLAAGGAPGRQRRFGGGFGSASRARQVAVAAAAGGGDTGGAGGGVPPDASHADAALGVGSPALLQVTAWQRLLVLLPLLPTVRADRDGDLRAQLAGALTALLGAPHLRPDALWLEGDDAGPDPAGAAAAAAAAAKDAGQPLLSRLEHVLCALLAGQWTGWLRGSNKRLREVPPYPGAAQLWASLDALPERRLPDPLRAQVRAALPLPPDAVPLLLPEPSAAGQGAHSGPSVGGADDAGAGSSFGGAGAAADNTGASPLLPRRWDPWAPLQPTRPVPSRPSFGSSGGANAATRQVAPAVALLAGCMKRRGGPLAYAGDQDDDECYTL